MKHKWATLVTMQSEIYYQNSQSFNPSEQFTLDHINMRHPVVVALEIQKLLNLGIRLFTSRLTFFEDDTRYSNLELVGIKSHSRKMVLLLLWPKIRGPLPPLGFRWSWCVVASSDIGNGTHFALIPLSHSLDAPQDPLLLFFLLPSTTN